MKKIISLILALVFVCASLVACSDGEVPDGMKSATVSGDPFILYVPESFTDNTSSGISSAFLNSLDNDLMVTARYYTPADKMTLDEYMNMCADSYALRLGNDFEKTAEIAGDTLGGADARRLEYKMTEDGVEYTVIQRTTVHGGDFISLNIYATGNALSVYEDYITKIVNNFLLGEKSSDADVVFVDKKTPDGMRIASSDIVEYRLYVQMDWECDPNSGVSDARVPATGANVTVTSYSPNDEVNGMTVSEYCDYCVEEYKETISGFSEIDRVVGYTKVADKDTTVALTFLAEYDGVSYKICQVMFYASEYNLYYALTYTAAETDFDAHFEDFREMLSAFSFR